jgi:putative Mg2+ transporter-C (MgtC) family protein
MALVSAIRNAQLLALGAGQGWRQVWELGLAFGLSTLIGLEREVRQKAAGLRTHTLVGTGAALFLLVSKYGFNDVLVSGRVILDPSRVAAGIVTGIGFIGGGLIFVRRDAVQGLTTAAIVWVTAAIGMACGAGLWLLALVVTLGHFIVVLVYPQLSRRLPRTRSTESLAHIVYRQREGILRTILATCTSEGLSVIGIRTREDGDDLRARDAVEVTLELRGATTPIQLAASLQNINGVLEARATDSQDTGD